MKTANPITQRRIIRSEALDALRAKDRDARRRLARHFVAFVRAPRGRKQPRGWIFYATDTHMATHEHRDEDQPAMFVSFMIGNPRAQVHGARDLVQELCEYNSDLLDEQDCHASCVVAQLKDFQAMFLEAKDEARANAVEFIFIDDRENLYWCTYDGSHAGQSIRNGGQSVIIRGCYDNDVRREVRSALRSHCRVRRPTKASLQVALRKIRRATRLPNVGYVPIP